MTAIAEILAEWAAGLSRDAIPSEVADTLRRALLDAGGLMVAGRRMAYVDAVRATAEAAGRCTAIGHAGGFTAGDAALISGVAVHGEDFDDTFEGTPVHVGAVLVPALLAAAERDGLSGESLLCGLAAGGELACRMAVVAPTAIHRAAFHPTAVIGALAAAFGVSAAQGASPEHSARALGIAGSMASGIIEYLAEGTSTKRLHPGWAAQSGLRAASLASRGFTGPRTVFEGEHGFFRAFAHRDIERDFGRLTDGLGARWELESLAFKPYACGTMAQPFIDAAISLRGEIGDPDAVTEIVAPTAEAILHRLWEPMAEKTAPSTPYSAKFSVPY
ncbi:MAG: MmgE/PrpD family protein [Inquilinus sp.]|nr:MmgE/PrpD family protein [Inquilinus sp.]